MRCLCIRKWCTTSMGDTLTIGGFCYSLDSGRPDMRASSWSPPVMAVNILRFPSGVLHPFVLLTCKLACRFCLACAFFASKIYTALCFWFHSFISSAPYACTHAPARAPDPDSGFRILYTNYGDTNNVIYILTIVILTPDSGSYILYFFFQCTVVISLKSLTLLARGYAKKVVVSLTRGETNGRSKKRELDKRGEG